MDTMEGEEGGKERSSDAKYRDQRRDRRSNPSLREAKEGKLDTRVDSRQGMELEDDDEQYGGYFSLGTYRMRRLSHLGEDIQSPLETRCTSAHLPLDHDHLLELLVLLTWMATCCEGYC